MSTPEQPRARPRWRLLIAAVVVAAGMALGPVLLVARLAAGPAVRTDMQHHPATPSPSGVTNSLTVTAADGRQTTRPPTSAPPATIRLPGTAHDETGG